MDQHEKITLGATDKTKYFTKITQVDREKVKDWLKGQEEKIDQEIFLTFVKKAVHEINYDYWIATLEPSVSNGRIFYAGGENVGVGFLSKQWENMAQEYEPEKGSRLANLYELFLWYALRIVNNLWSLEDVVKNTMNVNEDEGPFNILKEMGKTGSKECGGYRDGQGNTCKIVTVDGGFALVGGLDYLHGKRFPVTVILYNDFPCYTKYHGTGVVVLTK